MRKGLARNRWPHGVRHAIGRALAFAMLLWMPSTGLALDPARPLSTQAHRIWRSEDGLFQDSATALLESRSGFLWVGTREGLVRFDGASFEHFSRMNIPGFVHNEVQCLAETDDGSLWIGTTEPGLYRLRHGSIQALGSADGLPDRPVRRLFRDGRGALWVVPTEGPLYRLEGLRFRPIPSDASQLRILALTESADGILWAGTAGAGLWRVRQDRLVLAALTAADITALDSQPDGTLWVGTRTQGLLTLIDGHLEAPAWSRALPPRPITALLHDHRGSLWVGTEQAGLFRRNPAGLLEASPEPAGTRWTVLSLLEDHSGAIWSGGDSRGLHVLHPVPFQRMPVTGDSSEGPVSAVCQDSEGRVWCLLGGNALGLLQRGRIEPVKPQGPSDAPSAIWPRQAGGLWLGTRGGGIQVLEQGRLRRLPSADGPRPEGILSLYEDPGGTLWVATMRHGLTAHAPGAPARHFPAISGVLAMAGGGAAPLYLANRTLGFGILEGDQIRWLGRREGLGSSGTLSLHLDREGSVWTGTPDGLRRYKDGRFTTFSDRTGTLLMPIYSLLEDAAGWLWMGTSQGVFRIQRKALLGGLDEAGSVPIGIFDHRDGMPSRDTQGGAQPLSWLTREGNLCFATNRGLAYLDRRALDRSDAPIRLHKLKAESDETQLPEGDVIQVPPGTRRFEIYYTATALTRADKVRFRYRLEGLEKTWNEIGDRRFAAYSNLPPGSYRFALQAWRVDEARSPQELFLPVQVRPYLHQRPLFWVGCSLALAAFVWWLLRLRLQQVEARTAVLAERNRMAREIHDHLAQGFTGVMLQLEAAEARLTRMEGDPAPVLTRIEHARDLAAASLQEARRSVMSLHPRKPEGTDLLGALRLLSNRLLAGTDIQVEFAQTGQPRPLGGRREEELLRMAQEALTNALRHGKARWVRVGLHFEGRTVCLSIDDDGRGFDPSSQPSGFGLRSIRESIKQLGGHLDIESSQGLGSRLTITLPIRRWRS